MPKTLTKLNSKQQKTLEDVLKNPIAANLVWNDVESLFRALGCQVKEGNGSRVSVVSNNTVGHFHKPHPSNETNRGTVKSVRLFLHNAGIIVE
ncbi:type II toxin-antitoxin system HicA family toxin [Myxosarcina sp. GI1]|uniref:type II toxin-antitoxin system HicA family toxin n=1 Tax=Myxosarcina sp. GI1 TaxID=1541065 RepID=UPI00056A6E62|nr:type II toxin-antitoxin system HicA family toxin [Myxosarcina sp. GI1]